MTKQEQYEAFLPQLQGLIDEAQESVSVLANVCAALHAEFGWWWTGFYLVRGHAPGHDLGIHTAFPHAPRYQLGILPAEIQDQDLLISHGVSPFKIK